MSATLEGIFDPNAPGNPPVMGGGQNLPPSDKSGHLVAIVDSTMKQTKSGTGTMLVLTLRILEGPQANSEGDWNLNVANSNQTTVRIAMQELSCICHAVGHMSQLQDVAVLHNKPFRVIVNLQSGENGEKGFTEVNKVLRADGSKVTDPPASSGGAAPAPAPAQAAPATAPAAAQPATAATPGGFPVTESVAPPAEVAPAPAQAAPAQAAPAPTQVSPPAQQPAEAAPAPAQAPWTQAAG